MIFRIDSGGGSAVASEIIRQEMVRTAQQMPVIVSMSTSPPRAATGSPAAPSRSWPTPGPSPGRSGSMPATSTWTSSGPTVWVSPSAGSISDATPISTAASRAGVMISGSSCDACSTASTTTSWSESRALADLSREDVDAIGRGRVWTGVQALDRGLVDRLGGFSDAVEAAEQLAGIAPRSGYSSWTTRDCCPWWQEMVKRRSEDEPRSARPSTISMRRGGPHPRDPRGGVDAADLYSVAKRLSRFPTSTQAPNSRVPVSHR